MKRAILSVISIILMFGISSGVYLIYYNHDLPIEYEDFESKEKYLYGDARFEGKFRSKNADKPIVGYDYFIKTDDVYITLYTSISGKEPLETDEDGYVTVTIEPDIAVDKVCYKCEDFEIILSVKDK